MKGENAIRDEGDQKISEGLYNTAITKYQYSSVNWEWIPGQNCVGFVDGSDEWGKAEANIQQHLSMFRKTMKQSSPTCIYVILVHLQTDLNV